MASTIQNSVQGEFGPFRALRCLPSSMPRALTAISAATFLVILAGSASADIAGVATVIDGDTIEVHGERIRLNGIDAPESSQTCKDASGADYPCGRRAAFAIADMIGRAPVTCVQLDTDQYGRVVARCSVAGEDVGRAMVQAGWALAFRKYALDYVGDEEAARIVRVGMWAGSFTPPWEFRRAAGRHEGRDVTRNVTPLAALPSDCSIKGNISRRGERIYHMPGQRYYERTRINPADGERMFCSETEAKAAGWRPAQR